jgi:hypothetical protein
MRRQHLARVWTTAHTRLSERDGSRCRRRWLTGGSLGHGAHLATFGGGHTSSSCAAPQQAIQQLAPGTAPGLRAPFRNLCERNQGTLC